MAATNQSNNRISERILHFWSSLKNEKKIKHKRTFDTCKKWRKSCSKVFIVNVQLNKNYVFSVPRTCSEYKDRGFSQSGQFMIDPDQQKGGSTKFIVYCDFENGNLCILTNYFR